MNVTVYRVLSSTPSMEDFVAIDKVTAMDKAEELKATVCTREFQLPENWRIFELYDEELIFDSLDNPYRLKLHEITDDPEKFLVVTDPIFSGLKAALEPVQ